MSGSDISKAYSYLAARKHQGAREKAVAWELSDDDFAGDPSFSGVSFLGTTILLPGDADAYLKETQTQVDAVKADVDANRAKLPADYLSSWDTFLSQWTDFYSKNYGSWNLIDGGRSLMSQTDVYVERLKQYQTKMVQLKVTPNAPGVVIDPSSSEEKGAGVSKAELAAGGLGLVAVVGVIAFLHRR